MKFFIAGATGVLGRRVVPRLISRGHQVAGLSRSAKNDEALERAGAEPRTGDLFEKNQMERLSADCEGILHLATAIPTTSRTKQNDWLLNDRIRREGTVNLLAAAIRHKCRVYVQQSVTLLYGDRKGDWVDESAILAESQPSMLRSAADMERLVMDAFERNRLPIAILRFGSFYAHDSAQTASMFQGIQQRHFPVLGDGRVYWNMIAVEDAAEAIVSAVESIDTAGGRVYNICDDEPVLSCDLADFIAENLQAGRPRRIPVLLGKLALGSELVRLLRSSVRCRNERAKKYLAWQPAYKTYREGIPVALAQWRGTALST